VVAALLLAAAAAWHPIHSSLTTVELRPGDSIATLTIKVYAEDFPPGETRRESAPTLASGSGSSTAGAGASLSCS